MISMLLNMMFFALFNYTCKKKKNAQLEQDILKRIYLCPVLKSTFIITSF